MKATILMTVCFTFLIVVAHSVLQAQENPLELFDKGKAFLNSGDYDQAIEFFSKAADGLDPGVRNAHVVTLARAKAYLGKGDLQNALRDVTQVIQSEGANGEIVASGLQLRSVLHLRRGRDKQALEDLTAALKVPHDSDLLRSLCFTSRGLTFTRLGNTDKALSDLNKAIELDPKSGFAYAGRAQAYLRQDNIEGARRDSEHALTLNPDQETRKMAEKILHELSIFSSGPSSVSVPMNSHGQIFVQVRFRKNGTPHRFLLDTGATCSLIDRELLTEISRDTEVKQIGKASVSTADGTSHQVTRYKVKSAFLYNLLLGEIEVYVFDKKSKRITNLLGTRSLRNVAVRIDNIERKVEITRKD
ncbi:MAG TPA: retroviral-like aspartic protease family protein [Desulfomonilaceae bacterium]|nr:retroviral-like aspartic protease family protein [Desulfomonilaceae bacterium]